MKTKRNAEINAGSMADIAFLLLIFFLVATTMDIERGLLVLLPPLNEDTQKKPIHDREILEILVNADDELQVEGKAFALSSLDIEVTRHLRNYDSNPSFSTHPSKAVVSLKSHAGTSYNSYIGVYDAIKRGYRKAREKHAWVAYQKDWEELEVNEQASIQEIYPMRISEAEPD